MLLENLLGTQWHKYGLQVATGATICKLVSILLLKLQLHVSGDSRLGQCTLSWHQMIPNWLNLKGEEYSPPLSLANLLEEAAPTPRIRTRRTATKPYKFSGSVFATQLLSRCVDWSKKNIVFTMLKSNFTRFGTTGEKVVWEDLPLELWAEIGMRQSNWLDILLFRSVCSKWRSCLPLPTRFPLRVPSLPNVDKVPCVITEVNIYRTLAMPELLVSQEVGRDDNFRTDFMLGGHGITTFRPMFPNPVMSFVDPWEDNPYSRLSFVCKAYHLRHVAPGESNICNNEYADKTLIISSNDDGVHPYYARAENRTVVTLLSDGRLALLRLGGPPENWVWDTDFCDQVFQDITIYGGRLCAVDYSGAVVVMDYNSLQMTQLSPPSLTSQMGRNYLV